MVKNRMQALPTSVLVSRILPRPAPPPVAVKYFTDNWAGRLKPIAEEVAVMVVSPIRHTTR
jgi:hypothetical protein